MKQLKYKFSIFLVIFLGTVSYTSLAQAPMAAAKDLSYGIDCKDGSDKLDISTNSQHEAIVKCKSGSKFTYSVTGNAKSSVKANCKDPEIPIANPDSSPPSKMTFFCATQSGSGEHVQTVKQDHTPTVKSTGARKETSGDSSTQSPVGTEYDSSDCTNGLDGDCKLVDLIVTITDALSALAAVVIVAMIIWGGIQYSMAGADPSKVQAAKQKIINTLVALVLLAFGFSIIQWLVPGGLI